MLLTHTDRRACVCCDLRARSEQLLQAAVQSSKLKRQDHQQGSSRETVLLNLLGKPVCFLVKRRANPPKPQKRNRNPKRRQGTPGGPPKSPSLSSKTICFTFLYLRAAFRSFFLWLSYPTDGYYCFPNVTIAMSKRAAAAKPCSQALHTCFEQSLIFDKAFYIPKKGTELALEPSRHF